MLSLILAFGLAQVKVITVREPRVASPWVQSVRASCGSRVLTVSGYGAAMPLNRAAEVLVNGKPVVGKAVRQLLDDLSHRGAAYRLGILCGRTGGITLRINQGEKQMDGSVRYQSAAAVIRDNQLVKYTGMEEGDANSFWFR